MRIVFPFILLFAFAQAVFHGQHHVSGKSMTSQEEDNNSSDDDTPREYVVLLAQDEQQSPCIESVLRHINMTTAHDNVRHVYNNSAFRGFSINANQAHFHTLNNLSAVSVMEKSVQVATTVYLRPNATWGLERISQGFTASGNSSGLHASYLYDDINVGQGVDIYVVDTGVYAENTAFGGRVTSGFTAFGVTGDTSGHGTHVAGITASNPYGVASKANIIAIKALDEMTGSIAPVIAGIDAVINLHDTKKANDTLLGSVIQLSLGTTYGTQFVPLIRALNSAVKAGIHVVVAAGNDGQDACQVSPASAGGINGSIITVGSISSTNMISNFSNVGDCVDLYSPGEDILSTWITGPQSNHYLDGTSMATPYVSGIVAYQIARNISLAQDPSAMKAWLRDRALTGMLNGTKSRTSSPLLANNGVSISSADDMARKAFAKSVAS